MNMQVYSRNDDDKAMAASTQVSSSSGSAPKEYSARSYSVEQKSRSVDSFVMLGAAPEDCFSESQPEIHSPMDLESFAVTFSTKLNKFCLTNLKHGHRLVFRRVNALHAFLDSMITLAEDQDTLKNCDGEHTHKAIVKSLSAVADKYFVGRSYITCFQNPEASAFHCAFFRIHWLDKKGLEYPTKYQIYVKDPDVETLRQLKQWVNKTRLQYIGNI